MARYDGKPDRIEDYGRFMPHQMMGRTEDFENPEETAYREAHKKAKKKRLLSLDGRLWDYRVKSLDEILEDHGLDFESTLGKTTRRETRNRKFRKEIFTNLAEGTTEKKDCFARNFEPLFPPKHEYATRWMNVYKGMNNGSFPGGHISAIEFLHYYYVEDGNNRTSVAKHKGRATLPSYVLRIVPPDDSSDEDFRRYHEFLEFEKKTGIGSIWFSEEGKFEELEKMIDYFTPSHVNDKYGYFLNRIFVPFVLHYDKSGDKKFVYEKGDLFLDFLNDIYDPEKMNRKEMKQELRKVIRERERRYKDSLKNREKKIKAIKGLNGSD